MIADRRFDLRTRITFLVMHLAGRPAQGALEPGWTPPLSAGDIAEIFDRHRITVRRVLAALVDDGYLERCSVSRRRGCGGERFVYRPAWEIGDLRGGAA